MEALAKIEQKVSTSTRVIHVFDREGDIAEVFDSVHREPLKVHAVYATEVDCPQAETPVSWMLLTTEVVADIHTAATILPGTLIAGILRNITKFSSRAVKSSDLDWRQKE